MRGDCVPSTAPLSGTATSHGSPPTAATDGVLADPGVADDPDAAAASIGPAAAVDGASARAALPLALAAAADGSESTAALPKPRVPPSDDEPLAERFRRDGDAAPGITDRGFAGFAERGSVTVTATARAAVPRTGPGADSTVLPEARPWEPASGLRSSSTDVSRLHVKRLPPAGMLTAGGAVATTSRHASRSEGWVATPTPPPSLLVVLLLDARDSGNVTAVVGWPPPGRGHVSVADEYDGRTGVGGAWTRDNHTWYGSTTDRATRRRRR